MRSRPWLVAALLLALAGPAGLAAPAAARPVDSEDIFRLTLLSGARIAPDGAHAAVVASRMDGPRNAYDRTILVVDTASGATRDATRGRADGDVAWAPDGKSFAFARAAGGAPSQIYRYTLADGRIAQLTHGTAPASQPRFSHDGSRLLYTVVETEPPHAAWIDFRKAGFTPSAAQRASDIRTIDELHFSVNGAGYVYDRHAHLWTMRADGSGARALTGGRYSENGASWSPDDRTVVFTSTRYASPSLGVADVYTVGAAGGPPRKLVSPEPVNAGPVFAPGGDRLWFRSGGVADTAEYPALVETALDGSARREIVAKNTVAWGNSALADMKNPGPPCGPLPIAGGALVTDASGPGYANLVRVDARSGAVASLTPERGEAFDCSVTRDGAQVAYLFSDFTHPAELYVASTASGAPRRLTHANDAYLAQVQLSTPQPFTVTDGAGFPVQAWFMPALGAKPGERRATLLDVHGGPETEFADTYFHELQFWAGRGYNVVLANPRGSVGYGHAFEAALAKDWGDAMFDDLERVMDAVVKRPDVDPARLAVDGGSYGGYAVLWILAHTDRYRAGIGERVVSEMATEQLSADFASDNVDGGYYAWGWPWQPGNLYWQQSPLKDVEHVHTPLLMLHSELDIETPVEQTLDEFTALKVLGKTVRYVAVPGENHDLSRVGSPIHRVERLNLLAEWLRGYVAP